MARKRRSARAVARQQRRQARRRRRLGIHKPMASPAVAESVTEQKARAAVGRMTGPSVAAIEERAAKALSPEGAERAEDVPMDELDEAVEDEEDMQPEEGACYGLHFHGERGQLRDVNWPANRFNKLFSREIFPTLT